MKFTLLTSALLGLALVATPQAIAGQSHQGNHHKYNQGHHKYQQGHHKYNRSHHHGTRIKTSIRHKSRSHHRTSDIIGGVIGGVILGTIIHQASNQSSRHHVTQTYTNYPAKRANYYNYYSSHSNQPNTNVIVTSNARNSYRVLNGNQCYLTNINKFGNEILTQVPKLNCGL